MPHIAITMYPGRSREIKAEVAEKMKEAIIAALKVDASTVSVSIRDLTPQEMEDYRGSIPAEQKFIG